MVIVFVYHVHKDKVIGMYKDQVFVPNQVGFSLKTLNIIIPFSVMNIRKLFVQTS